MTMFEKTLVDESATVAFGKSLISAISGACIIWLHGDLGAGKTTLSRGIIQGAGHQGNVKSPTYTLIEPYELETRNIWHFDLYRLADPEELEFMGVRDYFAGNNIAIIEWPERGQGVIPQPDLDITMLYKEEQRVIRINPLTDIGRRITTSLSQHE